MNCKQLLSTAGDYTKSINLSLLPSPPPNTELSGHDVCYLGPNGEDDFRHVTYCKDLPDGQRAMVGSWYLHPERHVLEYIVYVAISFLLIRTILPTVSQYPRSQASNLYPPRFIKITTLLIYSCQLIYKINGYPGKLLFMGMPCNVLWTIWMTLCFLPLAPQTMHIMHQLIIPYTSLAVVAVATPDTSDLAMWMEIPFFFFMHYALIGYVIYFLRWGRISVLPVSYNSSTSNGDGIVLNFIKWWTLACAFFGLFYFGVATPLSLKLGLNLNYMLSPPPTPGDVVAGPNFRFQSTLCCAAVFFFVQFMVTAVEVFGRVAVRTATKKSVWISACTTQHECWKCYRRTRNDLYNNSLIQLEQWIELNPHPSSINLLSEKKNICLAMSSSYSNPVSLTLINGMDNAFVSLVNRTLLVLSLKYLL